jgi:hypothetical protein
LKHQIAKTRGDLGAPNMLGQLAQEFGVAIGNYGSLRDAIGRVNPISGQWEPLKPDPSEYQRTSEAHARGAILVAAVFDAFIAIYKSRIADLLRIATGGSGVLPSGAIHPDLVNRLASEAARAAQHVLLMCIRALDYCPPVAMTFGDYLRALITADMDMVPYDDRGYRVAFIEAFRRRGIYPDNVRNLAIESLCWPSAPEDESGFFARISREMRYIADRRKMFLSRESTYDEMNRYRARLENYIISNRSDLGKFAQLTGLALDPKNLPIDLVFGHDNKQLFEVAAVFPAQRIGPDGNLLNQLVVTITQERRVLLDPSNPQSPLIPFRGGCTLILDLDTHRLLYRVGKPIDDEDRLKRQRDYMIDSVQGSLRATYFAPFKDKALSQPFALLHRGA